MKPITIHEACNHLFHTEPMKIPYPSVMNWVGNRILVPKFSDRPPYKVDLSDLVTIVVLRHLFSIGLAYKSKVFKPGGLKTWQWPDSHPNIYGEESRPIQTYLEKRAYAVDLLVHADGEGDHDVIMVDGIITETILYGPLKGCHIGTPVTRIECMPIYELILQEAGGK